MSAATPFWYGAEQCTIVALVPDTEGVRLTADQSLSDGTWRRVSDLRLTWADFMEFAEGVGQIVAALLTAVAWIRDYPDPDQSVAGGVKT